MSTLRAGTVGAPAAGAATSASTTLAVARAGLWLLLVAHAIAMWGTQWDIMWHLTIGRDSFWIPPHLMTYSGVLLLVLVSFGVLAWTSAVALASAVALPGTIRLAGITGTRGYHLAAWGIALTVLAAPIDDLWHRLFGLDVTLWSPPHLLGLAGGIINAAACWMIARETYREGSLARRVGMVVAGAFVYGAIGVGLQPAIRIGYANGGLYFFLYPMLAGLLAPLALIVPARLSQLRAAPVLVLLTVLVLGATGTAIARAGFAWIQPVSYIAEEIAKDPTSPIAVAHEMARKNGTRPGIFNPVLLLLAIAAALVMIAVDARRRPVLGALAYAATLFVAVSAALARLPAFAQSLPSAPETVIAAIVTAVAALASGKLASRAR